jgi:hypothetical protein
MREFFLTVFLVAFTSCLVGGCEGDLCDSVPDLCEPGGLDTVVCESNCGDKVCGEEIDTCGEVETCGSCDSDELCSLEQTSCTPVTANTSIFNDENLMKLEAETESSESSTFGRSLGSVFLDAAFKLLIKSGLLFSEKTVFTISYSEGYNINFKISEEEARSLLPENITPIKLKIIESEPEPFYYISMYLAGMESSMSIERVDLFTYGRDQEGDLTLFFLAGVMELPDSFGGTGLTKNVFKKVVEYMARDSRTGEPSYPHYYTDNIDANSDTLIVTYKDTELKLDSCSPVTTNERFSRDFVLANSQIYRNDLDKNVNYFNQSFIDAKLETRDLDCVSFKNLEVLHPMLRDLQSVQYYGSKDKKVTWYFEM